MDQVYNALGAEMNHYNPSNPYVYDKTESEAGKGNALEELFTSIGRKALNGEGNEFYEHILNGSSVLNSGNKDYSEIPEELLDFCSHPLQCPNLKFDHNKKQSVKVEEKGSSMTIGAGLTLDMAKALTTINVLSRQDKELSGKYLDYLSKNTFSLEEINKMASKDLDSKLQESIARESAKLFEQQKPGIELSKKYNNTDYLTKGAPSYELTEEDKVNMADMGLSLMVTGHPAAVVGGAFLVLPKGLDYLYGAASDFRKGDIEGGIINSAGLISLVTVTSVAAYNSSGNTIKNNTNTSKGMTPEVAEAVNKNYGTNYIPATTQLNLSQNRREEFLSQVENVKLRNLIESDYRENGSVNDGGVASVIGMDVGNSDHVQKSKDLIKAYTKILNQSDNAKVQIENARKSGNDISQNYNHILLNSREEKVVKELIQNLKEGRNNYFNSK